MYPTYINRGLDQIKTMWKEYGNVEVVIGIDQNVFDNRSINSEVRKSKMKVEILVTETNTLGINRSSVLIENVFTRMT